MKRIVLNDIRFVLIVAVVLLLAVSLVPGLGCSGGAASEDIIQDLTGMSETEAKAALEEVGIPFEIVYRPGPDDVIGLVIEQDPASGQELEETTAITLTVGSKGTVEVPSLLGLTQDEAAARLAAAGLNANPISQDTNNEAQSWLVLAQDPPAGTNLDMGSQVSITVGNYVPAATVTEGTSNQGSSYVTCPQCGGSGSISVDIKIPRLVACSNCGGSGFIETGAGLQPCPVCGGARVFTEMVVSETRQETCPTCQGSGRVSR